MELNKWKGELGIDFPNEIGYGSFVGEDELDENCVLSPELIRDFRLRQGFFEAYPPYDEENKLIFLMDGSLCLFQ